MNPGFNLTQESHGEAIEHIKSKKLALQRQQAAKNLTAVGLGSPTA
jgi:hypothetical protein